MAKRPNKILSDELRDKILSWVQNHEWVRVSPNKSDTLKIGKENVIKLLCEVSINELYNDLKDSKIQGILDEKTEKIVIGYDTFSKMLKKHTPNLKKATNKHLETCGCETCITQVNIQRSLNDFRKKTLARLRLDMEKAKNAVEKAKKNYGSGATSQVILKAAENAKKRLDEYCEFAFPNGENRHEKAKDPLHDIMCKPVEYKDGKYFKLKSILDRCDKCPDLPVAPYGMECSPQIMIGYEHYEKRKRCASRHGYFDNEKKECPKCLEDTTQPPANVSDKKVSVKAFMAIGEFFKERYKPALKTYKYHCGCCVLIKEMKRKGNFTLLPISLSFSWIGIILWHSV